MKEQAIALGQSGWRANDVDYWDVFGVTTGDSVDEAEFSNAESCDNS